MAWCPIFIILGLTVSSANAYACIITDFEDVQEAIQSQCTVLILKDIRVPVNTTLNLFLKDGDTVFFDGNFTQEVAAWGGSLVNVVGRNVLVSGSSGHLLDGQGAQYWKGVNSTQQPRPLFFRLELHNSTVRDLNIKNCPNHCIRIVNSTNVLITNVSIDNYDGYPGIAGEGKFAKNTDGFDVAETVGLRLENTVVINQDDCVAVESGSDMVFENMHCNGSHGLSISIGRGEISNVQFLNSRMEYCDNAIHVKTHNDGPGGSVNNILYKNISFVGTHNYAVSIQENYPSGEPKANVPITNLTLENVKGSMSGERSKAFQIICAENGCFDFHFENVEITGAQQENECINVPSNIKC